LGAAEPSEAGGRDIAPAELPAAFAEGWALPKPDAFLEFFMPLIHEDAVFTQPLLAQAHGHAQIDAMFRRLFGLMPEFVAVPRRWAVDNEVVFIESHCLAAVASTRVRFQVCDRFVVSDGRISERWTFFDPSPMVRIIVPRPWLWPGALRVRRGA
jgi:limonene-1,2-epoxide hydrolase